MPTQPALSVTVGLRCDDNLKAHVRFLADPALPFRIVNETCERCPIPDYESRRRPHGNRTAGRKSGF